MSSVILEDQFTSPCPSPCPWTTKSSKISRTSHSANSPETDAILCIYTAERDAATSGDVIMYETQQRRPLATGSDVTPTYDEVQAEEDDEGPSLCWKNE